MGINVIKNPQGRRLSTFAIVWRPTTTKITVPMTSSAALSQNHRFRVFTALYRVLIIIQAQTGIISNCSRANNASARNWLLEDPIFAVLGFILAMPDPIFRISTSSFVCWVISLVISFGHSVRFRTMNCSQNLRTLARNSRDALVLL